MAYLKSPSSDVQAILDEIKRADHFCGDFNTPSHWYHPGFVRLSDGKFVKFGTKVSEMEAEAMEFIRQKTNIPVPKVHFAFHYEGCGYIVMDFIEAETLEKAQLSLSDEQLLKIATELYSIVNSLRELGGEGISMGSWPRGPFRNTYFHGLPPQKEFETMDEFKAYWVSRIPANVHEAPEMDHTLPLNEPVVLTHGDLSCRNILIKHGRIASIVDWDTLGWYPRFWEYTFALRGAWYRRWISALVSVYGPTHTVGNYYGFVVDEALNNPTEI